MNSQDTLDVVLEMDIPEPNKESRIAEMNLWSQHLAALLNLVMHEDDRD